MKQLVARLASTIALGVMLSGFVTFYASAADISELTKTCTDCHGQNGASTDSHVPIIGGFSEQYVIDSLTAYIDEDRPCPEVEFHEGDNKGTKTDMCKITEKLNEEDIEKIAIFYASQEFVPAKQKFDPAKAALGEKIQKASCKKCHEDGGSSPDDDAGILAGQWMPYLENSFKEFVSGERTMPKKMKPKMDKLNDTDIENLVHYFGSLQ